MTAIDRWIRMSNRRRKDLMKKSRVVLLEGSGWALIAVIHGVRKALWPFPFSSKEEAKEDAIRFRDMCNRNRHMANPATIRVVKARDTVKVGRGRVQVRFQFLFKGQWSKNQKLEANEHGEVWSK